MKLLAKSWTVDWILGVLGGAWVRSKGTWWDVALVLGIGLAIKSLALWFIARKAADV